MKIEYTYKIISVDENARCMTILYCSAGNETMQISARLPFIDEGIETIVQMYAPLNYWEEQKKSVVVPDVGLSGAILYENKSPLNAHPNEVQL